MIMQYIDLYKIECTVLNTFIGTPESIGYNIEPFNLESKYFTNDFNKIISSRVIKELKANGCMSLLQTKLIAWCRDVEKRYQSEMLNIISADVIPMSVALKYYNEMKIQYLERLAANGR